MLGIYQLVGTIYLFGITIATSGVNLSVTRVVSEELAKENPGGVKKAMYNCLYICLVTSISASLLFFLSSDFIVTHFLHERVNVQIIYTICLALPLITLSSAISGYFAGVRRIYKNAIGQFIEHIAKAIICIFLISLYLPKGLDYACFALILGDFLSELISFMYIYIIFLIDKHKYYDNKSEKYNENYTKKLLNISIPVAVTSYIRSGLTTVKQVIIPTSLEKSGINCSKSLANYGIINGMALPIIMFPDIFIKSFASLLIPEFSRYYAKKDFSKAKKMTSILLFLIAICSILLSLILFLGAKKISIWLYQDISVSQFIKIFAPLALFIYADTIVDSILRGFDAQVNVMIINICDLVISVCFIYFCVPHLGVLGYIISIYISEIFNFFASAFVLFKVMYSKNTHNI